MHPRLLGPHMTVLVVSVIERGQGIGEDNKKEKLNAVGKCTSSSLIGYFKVQTFPSLFTFLVHMLVLSDSEDQQTQFYL